MVNRQFHLDGAKVKRAEGRDMPMKGDKLGCIGLAGVIVLGGTGGNRLLAGLEEDLIVTRTLPTLLGLKFNRASMLVINPTSPYNANLASARLSGQQARLTRTLATPPG